MFLVGSLSQFSIDRLQTRDCLASLAVPNQPLRASNFVLDPVPLGPWLSFAAHQGLLSGPKLHCDVKPILYATTRELTAVDGRCEFSRAVADDRHTLVPSDAALHQEVIQPRGAGTNPLADVRVYFGPPSAKVARPAAMLTCRP